MLKAHLRDRAGLIGEISHFLNSYDLQIIRLGTHVVSGNILAVEVFMNATWYVEKFEHEHYGVVTQEMVQHNFKTVFFAAFVAEMVFNTKHHEPVISISVNDQLTMSSTKASARYEIPVIDSCINIPEPTMQKMLRLLGNHKGRLHKKLLASVVSDPGNALCRVYLFYKDTGIVHVRIRTNNNSGALASVCSLLNSKGFNIVQCFSRTILGDDNKECLLIDGILCLSGSMNQNYRSDEEVIERLVVEPFRAESANRNHNAWEVTIPRMLKKLNCNNENPITY